MNFRKEWPKSMRFVAVLLSWLTACSGLASAQARPVLRIVVVEGEGSVNNIQLGKNGRWRSNLWSYPGASSVSSDSRKGLELHPTVKPAAMLTDAMLDLTDRGDIVLDPFLGSGSTLIAAQGIGRRCFGIELDPRYVDVVLKRYQSVYGLSAVLESTGETVDVVALRLQQEAAKG